MLVLEIGILRSAPDMPSVSVNGLKTSYESRGEGKPLILVHGAGGASFYWANQLSGLSKRLRVIAIDLPGHGKSERLKENASIETYAEHVVNFMRQLRIDKAVLLGHSMGGLVVQQLALKHPKLCEKLIIVESAACLNVPHEYPDSIRNQQFDLKELAYMAFSEKTLKNNPALIQQLMRPDMNVDLSVVANDFKAAGEVDFRKKLREIAVPTLIIVGLDDIMTPPEMAEVLQKGIKGSKLVSIPDAGHMSMMEKPSEFNEAILEFVGA